MAKEHKFIALSYLSEKEALLLDQEVNAGWTILGMGTRGSQTVVLLQRDLTGDLPVAEIAMPVSKELASGVITEAVVPEP